MGERKAAHLQKQDIKPLVDRHYPTEWCKEEGVYLDESAEDDKETTEPKARKCHLKSGKPGKEATYTIVGVTLALGRQLLQEHARLHSMQP